MLVDGFFRATFTITRQHGEATLLITPFRQFSKEDTAALTAEGARLLDFADAEARDIQFRPAE